MSQYTPVKQTGTGMASHAEPIVRHTPIHLNGMSETKQAAGPGLDPTDTSIPLVIDGAAASGPPAENFVPASTARDLRDIDMATATVSELLAFQTYPPSGPRLCPCRHCCATKRTHRACYCMCFREDRFETLPCLCVAGRSTLNCAICALVVCVLIFSIIFFATWRRSGPASSV